MHVYIRYIHTYIYTYIILYYNTGTYITVHHSKINNNIDANVVYLYLHTDIVCYTYYILIYNIIYIV